jgi:hypothetical protein
MVDIQKRYIRYTADVVTPGGDTNAYGEPCEPGRGAALASGWCDPDRPEDTYVASGDVAFDRWGLDDGDPLSWLRYTIRKRVGIPDYCEFPPSTIYGNAYVHPHTGVSVSVNAHIYGFTHMEIMEALHE